MTPQIGEVEYEPLAKYDRRGNLHLLFQEGKYYEEEGFGELQIVAIELVLTKRGVESNVHYFQVFKDMNEEE